ncbi:MAG: hypothetical protein Q9226_002192 [Calogaya cf. arnoldii]
MPAVRFVRYSKCQSLTVSGLVRNQPIRPPDITCANPRPPFTVFPKCAESIEAWRARTLQNSARGQDVPYCYRGCQSPTVFRPVDAVLRQVHLMKPASETTVSLQEMLDICDTEGNNQNGVDSNPVVAIPGGTVEKGLAFLRVCLAIKADLSSRKLKTDTLQFSKESGENEEACRFVRLDSIGVKLRFRGCRSDRLGLVKGDVTKGPESSSPASFEKVREKWVPESSPEVREKHKWRAEIKAQKAELTEDIEPPSSIPSFYQEQTRARYNTHTAMEQDYMQLGYAASARLAIPPPMRMSVGQGPSNVATPHPARALPFTTMDLIPDLSASADSISSDEDEQTEDEDSSHSAPMGIQVPRIRNPE